MASMKAKKGNPFEKAVMYSLLSNERYIVNRFDDNTPGIDLIISDTATFRVFYVECKFHKKFSFNQLEKIYNKTKNTMKNILQHGTNAYTIPMLIFKMNNQPPLCMYEHDSLQIRKFEDVFVTKFQKAPAKFQWKKFVTTL